MPLGTPDTREKKEPQGRAALVVLKASQELKASGENRGLQGRRELRERKVKKELLVPRGAKGDTGRIGSPGVKGSFGFKGNKGSRGITGIQGPKGECSVVPKICVFPESQYVFVNRSATFYCWVQGQSVDKITWRKLENDSLRDIRTTNGILYCSIRSAVIVSACLLE